MKPDPTPCPKCGELREVERIAYTGATYQRCTKNGCDTWTASNVGTNRGGYKTRGGPRGQIAEIEK